MPPVDPLDIVKALIVQTHEFQAEVHGAFSAIDRSTQSRILSLEQTRKQLAILSPRQNLLLDEALRCVEYGLFRAAHVSAWQAYIDMLSEKIASDGFTELAPARIKWPKLSTVEELREYATEHELINVARDLRLVSKAEAKVLHGLLAKRNECAHPSTYVPGPNEAIGYVSELISRMQDLSHKTL